MKEPCTYSDGDWIVHALYGVGQIKGIEVKGISGEETHYYRVETTDSTFWVPVDQMDSEMIRPLSTPEEIQQAIAALQIPAKEMSSNFKTRQSRIKRVRLRNTPRAIARLVRDLWARRRDKGVLNGTERSAFLTLKQRLVEEWAIVTDAETEKVASKLDNLLEPHQESTNGQKNAVTPQETAAATPSRNRKMWWEWPRRQTNKVNR